MTSDQAAPVDEKAAGTNTTEPKPTESKPKAFGPPFNDLDDIDAREAARAWIKDNPDAKLFTFNMPDDPRDFVGRVGSYQRVVKLGKAVEKNEGDLKAAWNLIDYLLVYPKPSYVELDDHFDPGHVVKMQGLLLIGNGFDGTDSVKKIWPAPGSNSSGAGTKK
ncbi:hypothetical protein K8I61_17260 [bacterium]|nr:hypothetical protein [bacterium]